MDSLCDFLSNTKLPEKNRKEQKGKKVTNFITMGSQKVSWPALIGQLLLDLNLSSSTQSASPMMVTFSFKRRYSMTLLFGMLFSFWCFPSTAFCQLFLPISPLSSCSLRPFRPLSLRSEVQCLKYGVDPSGNCYNIFFGILKQLHRGDDSCLRKYFDQDFSYTDSISFAIMKRYKIGNAFSFDKHFVTAGFVNIPP